MLVCPERPSTLAALGGGYHMPAVAFSEWVKTQIERRGMSQGELSRRIGKTASFVSKLVNGLVGADVKTVRLIADAFGMPQTEVLAVWLSANSSDDGTVKYMDRETARLVEHYHRLGVSNRKIAERILEALHDGGDAEQMILSEAPDAGPQSISHRSGTPGTPLQRAYETRRAIQGLLHGQSQGRDTSGIGKAEAIRIADEAGLPPPPIPADEDVTGTD